MSRRLIAACATFCVAVLSSPVHAHNRFDALAVQYHVIEILDLTPDGHQGYTGAGSINDRGEVIVGASDAQSAQHTFVWRRGRLTEIVSPDPGLPFVGSARINNRSQVFGTLLGDGPYDSSAFVWQRGHLTELPALPSSGRNTYGGDINDFGEGVGTGIKANFFPTVFTWFHGRFRELPFRPDAQATAAGINNRREIIGSVNGYTDGPVGGFLFRNGQMRFLDLLPGAEIEYPVAINDRSQIAGTAIFPAFYTQHAFLWENGTVQDLGTLPGFTFSEAAALNDFGTVVGRVGGEGLLCCEAMIWREGIMRNLNELIAPDDPLRSSVHLTQANGINDFGWITASGRDANFHERGYILIPYLTRKSSE